MGTLLKFEFKRFWKNRKNYFLLLGMFLVIAFLIILFSFLDKQYQNMEINNLNNEKAIVQNNIRIINSAIDVYRELENKDKEYEEDKIKRLTEIKELMVQWNSVLIEIYSLRRDQVKRLPYEISRNEIILRGYEEELIEYRLISIIENDIDILEEEIKIKRYLLEHNIRPLSSPYEVNMQNFISRFLSYPFSLIWVLVILISCFDIISEDFSCGTYKVLYSEKYTRRKIYFSKNISGIINSGLLYMLLMLIVFIYFLFNKSLGNFNYPVYVPFKGVIPYKNVLLMQIPFILFSWLTIVSLVNLIGIIMKEYLNVILILLTILIFDFILRDLLSISNIIWKLWPLSGLELNIFFNATKSVLVLIVFIVIQAIWLALFNIYAVKKLDTKDL